MLRNLAFIPHPTYGRDGDRATMARGIASAAADKGRCHRARQQDRANGLRELAAPAVTVRAAG
jgi:hypothetical protein